MSAFAFLLAARQLGQEGDCGFLIQTATSVPNNTRGLAFDHADCVSADEQQNDNF